MRKVVNRIVDGVIIAIVAIVVAMLIGVICGVTPYIVMSGSMETAIHTGSVCFVNENVEYEEIEVGDIIAFEAGTGVMVTHRVIDITDEGFETKGDNNDVSDGISTTKSNYCGETVLAIPYVGYALAMLQTKRGMIIGATVIACLFIICFMTSGDKKPKDEDNEEDEKKE